jgi:hypothetical protein
MNHAAKIIWLGQFVHIENDQHKAVVSREIMSSGKKKEKKMSQFVSSLLFGKTKYYVLPSIKL